MVTKIVAGACLAAFAALATTSEPSSEGETARANARPVVVRVSLPLPAGAEPGSASFSATLGATRWHVAATAHGGKGRAGEKRSRFVLLLASEPSPAE
jgi:hypothetical protein